MGESRSYTNATTNCQKEMALDWPYIKKARKVHSKTGSKVESSGNKEQEKTKRNMEEVCGERDGAERADMGRACNHCAGQTEVAIACL